MLGLMVGDETIRCGVSKLVPLPAPLSVMSPCGDAPTDTAAGRRGRRVGDRELSRETGELRRVGTRPDVP